MFAKGRKEAKLRALVVPIKQQGTEEPNAMQHCRKNSSLLNLRKLITEKTSQKARTKAKQRKLMELILKADTRFIGRPQLMKADQKRANENAIPPNGRSNANTPLKVTNQEPTVVQNVLGGLVNAKTPITCHTLYCTSR